MDNKENLIKDTQNYHDSKEAIEFRKQVWGGEDNHIGIYSKEITSIEEASKNTSLRMLRLVPAIKKGMKILILGAGYGAAARLIAEKYGCKIDCLNISEQENKLNAIKNKAQELDELISITAGNFEQIPFNNESYDLVWSQDALLHSAQKENIFREVNRVLKPEGRFIFTDIMQSDNRPDGSLEKALEQIPNIELGSVIQYKRLANVSDLERVYIKEMPEQLIQHHTKILATLNNQFDELSKKCTKEWLNNKKKRLESWVKAGNEGHLNWGILQFQKQNS